MTSADDRSRKHRGAGPAAGSGARFCDKNRIHRAQAVLSLPMAPRFCWTNLPAARTGASRKARRGLLLGAMLLLCLAAALSARADMDDSQEVVAVDPVELLTDEQLQTLVGPVALYPDDLLAIVLPAATFPLQVVLAARYLEARETDPNLEPDAEWDASIVALLNYPEIVALLDRELRWTWQLGEAVILQQEAVIAAVSDFRKEASAAGNLASDDNQVVSVTAAGDIEIVPVEREVIYVPYYDPREVVVYQPKRVYHYFPRAYPVYYYPYPSGHYFSNGAFWGVTSAFSIGWLSRSLHWHHYGFRDHPYYGYSYYDPFYYRRPHVWIELPQRDRSRRDDRRHRDDNRWWNDDRHGGSRPGRRGAGNRPDRPDSRFSDRRSEPLPPGARNARGIERTLAARPGKPSGQIPLKGSAQRGDSRAVAAETNGTRAARPDSPRSTARTRRAENVRSTATRRAIGQRTAERSGRTAARTAPGNAQQFRDAINRSTGVSQPALRRQPVRSAASAESRTNATPIRKPSTVQRATVSPRVPQSVRSPGAARPGAVKQPAKRAAEKPQPRQRPRASSSRSSLGSRAEATARNAAAAVIQRTRVAASQTRAGAGKAPSGRTAGGTQQFRAPSRSTSARSAVRSPASRPAPNPVVSHSPVKHATAKPASAQVRASAPRSAPTPRSAPVRSPARTSASGSRDRQSRLSSRRRPEH